MKIDIKILRFLYRKKNDGNFYDVSKHIKHNLCKNDLDKFVVELESNGYVSKRVEGYLPASAIPEGGNLDDANNSICKITSEGIAYLESHSRTRKIYIFTLLGIIISIISLILEI